MIKYAYISRKTNFFSLVTTHKINQIRYIRKEYECRFGINQHNSIILNKYFSKKQLLLVYIFFKV